MRIGRIARHYDALSASGPEIKKLVASPFDIANLSSFRHSWDGTDFDIFAFIPVIEGIQDTLDEFRTRYGLSRDKVIGFLMSPKDAQDAAECFDFLSFLADNCINVSTASPLLYCLETVPQIYALAANPGVAIAASQFGVKCDDFYIHNPERHYEKTSEFVSRGGFIPIYGSKHRGCSDYTHYLTEPPTGICSFVPVGDYAPSHDKIATCSSIELISEGMKILPRELWADLIYECRRQEAFRANNLHDRVEMVKLHVALSLYYEKQKSRHDDTDLFRYVDILDPSLLLQFPQLVGSAVHVLTFPSLFSEEYPVQLVAILRRAQEDDLLLHSVQQMHPGLITAVSKFYSKCPQTINAAEKVTPILLSPAASILTLRQLEQANTQHRDLDAQLAILLALKVSFDMKNAQFAVASGTRTSTTQQFILMLRRQLDFKTSKDTEVCKGLLQVAIRLINQECAIALACDAVTLSTLTDAVSRGSIQALAVRSLSEILGADLLCFTYATEFWPKICSINDSFALALLYQCLVASDRGREIIEQFSLTKKLLASVSEYNRTAPHYSEKYYCLVTDCVTANSEVLGQFASGIPKYLSETLCALDASENEHHYDTHGFLFNRDTKTERIVDHCVWLLAAIVHREPVRKQLLMPECIDILLKILAHPHLPYQYFWMESSNSFLQTLMQELALTENMQYLMVILLEKLAESLDSGDMRTMSASFACIRSLSLVGPDSLRDTMIPLICDNVNMHKICTSLPARALELCYKEASLFAGEDAAIVECFWGGYKELIIGAGSIGQKNSKQWAYSEVAALKKLENEVSFEKYDKIRAGAKFVRFSLDTLKQMSRSFTQFFTNVGICKLHDVATVRELLVTSCLEAMNTISLENVEDRYAFCAFQEFQDSRDELFVPLGGLKVLVDAYTKLCIAKRSKGSERTLKCHMHNRSDYFHDCMNAIELKLSPLDSYFCTEKIHDTLGAVICHGRGIRELFEGLGYLLKKTAETHIPFLPGVNNIFIDQDHDLEPYLWIRDFIVTSCGDILVDQSPEDTLKCARFLATIIIRFERHNPVIEDVIARLYQRADTPSLALLGALIDQGQGLGGDASKIPAQIESNDPKLVMCAAQVLKCCPNEIPAISAKLLRIVTKTTHTYTLLMLMELITAGILHQCLVPTQELVCVLLEHCLSVFEQNDFDYACALGLVSLMDTIRTALDSDSSILAMIMAYIMAANQGPQPSAYSFGTFVAKLCKRSASALQEAAERYLLIDPDTQELYWRRYLYMSELASFVQAPPLQTLTESICDLLMSKYTSGASELLAASLAYYEANQEYENLHYRTATFEEIAWGGPATEKATKKCLTAWEHFRRLYMKQLVSADSLIHITHMYSSATVYLTTSAQFNDFVAASIKCSTALALHLSFVGCWNEYTSSEHFRTQLFWPVVNILKSSNEQAIKRVFDGMEFAFSTSTNSRETACGVLYMLQIQEIETPMFIKQLQQSNVMTLCEQSTDFKDKRMHEPYRVERLVFKLVDKISTQIESFNTSCLKSGVPLVPVNDDFTLPEPTVFAHTEIASGDGQDEQEQENEQDQDSEAGFNDGAYYDDESDYEPEYALNEIDGEPSDRIAGSFDEGAFRHFLPQRRCIYTLWEFNAPNNEGIEAKTMADSYNPTTERDTAPLYLWSRDSEQLLCRGMELGPGKLPADSEFECEALYPWGQFQLRAWPTFSGRDLHIVDWGGPSSAYHLTRPWESLEPRAGAIDWNKVENIDKEIISGYQPETNEDSSETKGATGENVDNADSGANKHTESPVPNQDTDFAIRKACELLEDPDSIGSWGIDRSELESMPEELQFEALVSWIMIYKGEEMSTIDILATLDETNLLDLCDQDSTEQGLVLPESLKLATKAQLSRGRSVNEKIEQHFFKHNQMPSPQWSEKMHIELSYQCREDYVRYPSKFSNKQRDNALLEFFLENVTDLPAQSVSKILDYFYDVSPGSLNAIQLLEIIDMPIITVDICFNALAGAVRVHIEAGLEARPLKGEIIDKLINAFYTRTLLPRSRQNFVSLVEVLVAKGFVTQSRLRAHVYKDLLAQLDMCMSIKSGVINTKAFSDLEATLSVLSTQKICELDKNNAIIVEKAMELGPHVSDIIKGNDASGIRLLRCYLLLVSLASDARPAFVKFVQENRSLVNKIIVSDRALLEKCAANLKGHYDLLDYPVKVQLVNLYSGQPEGNIIEVNIRRDKLVDDTLVSLKSKNFKAPFRIKFSGEMGFDDGGLTREWLILFGRGLPDSDFGLFSKIAVGNHFSIHPNPQSLYEPSNVELYEVVGKIMAKAILVSKCLDCKFSSVIYKALLSESGADIKLSIEDVEQFDPQLASSLRWIRDNDITDVIMENFSSKSMVFGDVQLIELKPNGKSIEVTEANKHEYIDLMAQHIYKSVEKQIGAISKGFRSLLPLSVVKVFSAPELERLLCGSQEIDVAEWRASTSYRGYTSDSTPVKVFWQVVEAMSNDERRKLLMFVTGSDSVSSLGFTIDATGTKFVIAKQTRGNLPVASTCLSTIHIPPYSSYDEARVELSKTVELGSEGFGLM